MNFSSIQELDEEYFKYILEPKLRGDNIIYTGIPELDDIVSMEKGWLLSLGGRPKSGKTMFATGMAIANAIHGTQVDIYSLEMSRRALYYRWLQVDTGVDSGKIRRGEIDEKDLEKLKKRRTALPFYVNNDKAVNLNTIMETSAKRITEAGTGLIIIDYTQLVNGIGGWKKLSYAPNREQLLSTIVYGLADLREYNVGIVLVAQLNRDNDYRETEAFQQASDLCIKMVSPDKAAYGDEDIAGYFDILNRHDEGGHLHYLFRRKIGKFMIVDSCNCE